MCLNDNPGTFPEIGQEGARRAGGSKQTRELKDNNISAVQVAINTRSFKESHDQITNRVQPFLDKYPKNSSWEIASTLPALIPASSSNPTPIHIHVHHEPIRVAYRNVVDIVPKLLTTTPTPDIVLHIGLAASRRFFAIEQGAHSRGYGKTNDVDGDVFQDSEAQKVFPDAEYPSALHTGFDTEDVLSRWRTSLGDPRMNKRDGTVVTNDSQAIRPPTVPRPRRTSPTCASIPTPATSCAASSTTTRSRTATARTRSPHFPAPTDTPALRPPKPNQPSSSCTSPT